MPVFYKNPLQFSIATSSSFYTDPFTRRVDLKDYVPKEAVVVICQFYSSSTNGSLFLDAYNSEHDFYLEQFGNEFLVYSDLPDDYTSSRYRWWYLVPVQTDSKLIFVGSRYSVTGWVMGYLTADDFHVYPQVLDVNVDRPASRRFDLNSKGSTGIGGKWNIWKDNLILDHVPGDKVTGLLWTLARRGAWGSLLFVDRPSAMYMDAEFGNGTHAPNRQYGASWIHGVQPNGDFYSMAQDLAISGGVCSFEPVGYFKGDAFDFLWEDPLTKPDPQEAKLWNLWTHRHVKSRPALTIGDDDDYAEMPADVTHLILWRNSGSSQTYNEDLTLASPGGAWDLSGADILGASPHIVPVQDDGTIFCKYCYPYDFSGQKVIGAVRRTSLLTADTVPFSELEVLPPVLYIAPDNYGSLHIRYATEPTKFTFSDIADLPVYLSGGTGNTVPGGALGGARSTTQLVSGVDLYDGLYSNEICAGKPDYRCLYVRNISGSELAGTIRLWVDKENLSVNEISLGVDPAGIDGVAQTLANENVTPTGVDFVSATSEASSLVIPSLPAGSEIAVWLRRTPARDSQITLINDPARLYVSVINNG